MKTKLVVPAFWLQAYFENKQILFPAKHLVSDYTIWQAFLDELLLFPQAEHDDLFDGLQTMIEGCNYPGFKPGDILSGSPYRVLSASIWDDHK